MNCGHCSTPLTKNKKFCSNACIARHYGPLRKRKEVPCPHCGKPTRTKYCSPDCAGKHNNPKHPYYCKGCQTLVGYGCAENKYCNSCKVDPKINKNYKDWSQVTLASIFEKYPVNQAHAKIREKARSAYYRSGGPKECANCGYSKYIEVCHIKQVKDFDRSTSVAEVNEPKNLIALCRNCHWEFDHGHLTLDCEPALAA